MMYSSLSTLQRTGAPIAFCLNKSPIRHSLGVRLGGEELAELKELEEEALVVEATSLELANLGRGPEFGGLKGEPGDFRRRESELVFASYEGIGARAAVGGSV